MAGQAAEKATLDEKPGTSLLWHRALERYRQELEGTDDFRIVQEVHSLDDLLRHVSNLHTMPSREKSAATFLNRLGPKFKFVDDFLALIALCFGANGTITAMVWGSIRLIVTLASSAGDALRDILDMLEELSLTLPRFKIYEDTLPMNRDFEACLVDLYAEVICFYARTIHFFRSNPHVLLQQHCWQGFRNDFAQTLLRIKRMSTTVESEADRARMRVEETRYREVLELMDHLSPSKVESDVATQFHYLPFTVNNKFCGRELALEAIREAFASPSTSLNSIALIGMGGVGKTQLAMHYATQSLDCYDVILWIAADNAITLSQSFRSIAQGLGLIDDEEVRKDSALAMLRVKNWLAAAKCSWLAIFDNADEVSSLRLAWPACTRGAILVTTRNSEVADRFAAQNIDVRPFDEHDGPKAMLQLIGIDTPNATQEEHAKAINHKLGGLPLALGQMAGFIRTRKLPLEDFLSLYAKHSSRIDAKKSGHIDHEHTLSTVWDVSLEKLPEESSRLLTLLAFFDPDAIHEQIFLEGSQEGTTNMFTFLNDDFEYVSGKRFDGGDDRLTKYRLCEAEEPLLRSSLINKNAEEPILSIHRLMQSAAIRRVPESESALYFDTAVRLLSWGFPDTWSQDVGHQFRAWVKCEMCLPHIDHLVRQAEQYKILPKDVQSYGELLLRCSWYLYEREMYGVCRKLTDAALMAFEDKTTLAYASALDLAGLIDLDLNNAGHALGPFERALKIRRARLGPDDPFIASSLNNIALSYTEMDRLEDAYAVHQEAIGLRSRNASDRIGNSYSNMSSLLLKMQRPDEAEEMLARCPSLKDFTDETFLNTENPRFSGDMVLLSRIRLQQGRLDDAMRLASKALVFRQKLLGNRLKTCDSLYDVASLLHKQDKKASAIKLLTQLISNAESLPEGQGQLARANYKLAVIYNERGLTNESNACKARALEVRAKLRPHDGEVPFEEENFRKLCLWMLW